jgi:hypothetical protein
MAQPVPTLYCYAPFTKNRREIVTIQKKNRLGSFHLKRALTVWNLVPILLPYLWPN